MTNRPHALRAVPGFYSNEPGIQLAAQTSHTASDEDLQFFQQPALFFSAVQRVMTAVHPQLQKTLVLRQAVVRLVFQLK